jgi:hypothetical protein
VAFGVSGRLTVSNQIFLPTAYSPALICFGRERGWWITCNYPTVLKERNRKSTTCAICWLKSVLHEEKRRTGFDSERTTATKPVSDVFRHRSGTRKSYCRTRFDVGSKRVKAPKFLDTRHKVVTLTHRPSLNPLLIFRGWVDPRAHGTVWCTGKNPQWPGFDPGTLRLVAQCLNHYATPGPIYLLVHLSISTCFGRLFAHHQEKQLYLCDTQPPETCQTLINILINKRTKK